MAERLCGSCERQGACNALATVSQAIGDNDPGLAARTIALANAKGCPNKASIAGELAGVGSSRDASNNISANRGCLPAIIFLPFFLLRGNNGPPIIPVQRYEVQSSAQVGIPADVQTVTVFEAPQ